MNYLALQNEAMASRFKEAQRTQVKLWLVTAYAKLWNLADWEFKRSPLANLTVVAGSRTPTMPAAFAKTINLFDHNGDNVSYLPANEWENLYAGDTSRGDADYFTVINRQIYLGPTPIANRTFQVSYRRTLAHFSSDGVTVVAGALSADTDLPLWSVDHHEVLPLMARILGKQEQADPTWENEQQQVEELIQAMLEDLTVDRGGVPLQYGVDPL